MKRIYLSLISMSTVALSYGQISTSVLDFNNVSAYVTDGGILFNNPTGLPGYEIPKGSNLHALYGAGLWYGGEDANGQLKMTATKFIPGLDIFPGPVATATMYTTPAYLANYSPAIWSVTQAEIDDHVLNYASPGYITPSSIMDWPGNGDVAMGISSQLAPYQDENSNGIYEPLLGDYPIIRGHKATYIIMNDVAQLHLGSGSDPIGIEVHVMLYQYATNGILNDATFIHSTVFNRGAQTLYGFRSSFYADGDLGDYSDDYVGTDSIRNMIFTYNGTSVDGEYGINPPAIGIVSLNQQMDGGGYFSSSAPFPYNDPSSAPSYWNIMNNTWADGSPWVEGGLGYLGSPGASTTPSNYLFGGDPLNAAEWSESSLSNIPGDRRMIMNMKSETFSPGAFRCLDMVVVYGRDTLGPLSSVAALQNNADSLQAYYDAQNYICEANTAGIPETTPSNYLLYPNPSNGEFTIQFDEKVDGLKLRIVDLSGRLVIDQAYSNTASVSVKLNEASGVYVLQIETRKGIYSERILVK